MLVELAAINSAYAIVRSAVANGREITDCAKQIGNYFGLVEQAESEHRKERNRNNATGELEEALETWANVKKIREHEVELKNLIISQSGNLNAWNEIVQIRTSIRKKKARLKKEAEQRQAQILEYTMWGSLVAVILGGIGSVIWFSRYLLGLK